MLCKTKISEKDNNYSTLIICHNFFRYLITFINTYILFKLNLINHTYYLNGIKTELLIKRNLIVLKKCLHDLERNGKPFWFKVNGKIVNTIKLNKKQNYISPLERAHGIFFSLEILSNQNRNQIVFTIFRLIWDQIDLRLIHIYINI